MVYRFRYHGYKVLASIRWSVCTNQIICIRRLKVTGDKSKYCCLWRQPCLQCTTITIWLKKTDQNKKFLWLIGTQFAQNNKHLFKELSHQNEHLQRKWATLPMYICYSSRYIKNQLLMPLLQHIRHSRKTMPNISWWKRTCCWPSTLYL